MRLTTTTWFWVGSAKSWRLIVSHFSSSTRIFWRGRWRQNMDFNQQYLSSSHDQAINPSLPFPNVCLPNSKRELNEDLSVETYQFQRRCSLLMTLQSISSRSNLLLQVTSLLCHRIKSAFSTAAFHPAGPTYVFVHFLLSSQILINILLSRWWRLSLPSFLFSPLLRLSSPRVQVCVDTF